VRLTWHEAIVQEPRLIIRWPAEEKRLRSIIFVLLFTLFAGMAFICVRIIVDKDTQQQVSQWVMKLAGILFLYGFGSIWFSKLWVIDKNRNSILQGGWRKVANLDEFDRFVMKRENRRGNIMFVVLAERKDGGKPLELGIMDQDDAADLGRELARFTHFPSTSR